MSLTINGTIVQGLGGAAGSLSLQWQQLCADFPEIQRCGRPHGTINVQLDLPLRINNPHHTTPPIKWNTYYSNAPAEIFSFLRFKFECPLGAAIHEAWIYIPHSSPHRSDLFQVEVIAKFIPMAKQGERCCLRISDQHTISEVMII
jgi:CTP-dependent riboflavin kinase